MEFQMEEFNQFIRPHGTFDTFDLNHDGLIDQDEFPALIAYDVTRNRQWARDYPEPTADEISMSYDALTSIIGSQGVGRRAFMLSHQILAKLWEMNATE